MKVASIAWNRSEWEKIEKPTTLMQKIEKHLKQAVSQQVEIVVFPGFTGCFFQLLFHSRKDLKDLVKNAESEKYIEEIKRLSRNNETIICPGTYWKKENKKTYHETVLIQNGKVILTQRQIYLAQWERKLGFSRGINVGCIQMGEWHLGVIISTDVFYPQVSRKLALMGVDIILSPVGIIGEKSNELQMSGMWQEVQQNQFFAVESGFNGFLENYFFSSDSIIHAPLEMTKNKDGYLEKGFGQKKLVISHLDNEKRNRVIKHFDVLGQLNYQLYRTMKMFKTDGYNEKYH